MTVSRFLTARPKNVFEIIQAALMDLLATSDIVLSPSEIWSVVSRVSIVHHQAGHTLFRQGDQGFTAYILADGDINGRVEFTDFAPPKAFRLEAGTLIGEISLMSGICRTATIWAASNVKMLELSPTAFSHLLSLRPEMAEVLSKVVAERQVSDHEYLKRLKTLDSDDIKRTQNQNNILQHFNELDSLEDGREDATSQTLTQSKAETVPDTFTPDNFVSVHAQ
ncbi:MAG: cyclic nucleotide-binding domain-containing protein [Cyanobacteria bacterium P01_D01_bin.73]